MKCDHSTNDRVIVPGDQQPDGVQWPRCAQCYHRTSYADMRPTSTRRIAMKHPFYILTELRGRHRARLMAEAARQRERNWPL